LNFSTQLLKLPMRAFFGGIHFRTSCVRANGLGRAVADYVSRHAMRARGDDLDDEQKLEPSLAHFTCADR